jgi:hypothetical protein
LAPATINLLQGLAGALLFAAAGLAVNNAVPWLRQKAAWIRLAWSYLFGLVLVGAALWAGSHLLGLPLSRRAILPVWGLLAVVGIASEVWRLRRGVRGKEPRSDSQPRARCRLLGAAAVFIGLTITTALLADAAAHAVEGVDGRMTWVAHARYLRQAETVSPPVLTEERWLVAHPQYPKLLPIAQVAQLELWSSADERAIRPLYALFFPVLLALVYDGGRRLAGRVAGLLSAAALAPLPFLAFQIDGGAAGAYSDLPLACLWGGGLMLLACGPRDRPTSMAAGVLLGGAVLTKAEGLPLALVALVAAALRTEPTTSTASSLSDLWGRLRHRLNPSALAALPVAAAWGLLVSWQRGIPRRFTEDYLAGLELERLRLAADRMSEVAAEIAVSTLDPASWRLHWVLFPLLLAAGWRGWGHRRALSLSAPLLVAVAGAMTLYFLAYLASPWGEALAHQVAVTWPRFLMHLLVPLQLLLALALAALVAPAQRPRASPPR